MVVRLDSPVLAEEDSMTESYIGLADAKLGAKASPLSPDDDFSDADIAQFHQFVASHAGAMIKAPVTGAITAAAVYMASGRFWQAALIGAICCLMCAFRTWRRPLEFVALVCLVMIAIEFARPSLIASIANLVIAR
jgi:hypothetical protein